MLTTALLLVGLLHGDRTAVAADARRSTPQWIMLSCRLMPGETRDGDSFHVMTSDNRQFIFRLYFVDAPETDTSIKDRVLEQAEHFGVSEEEILKAGQTAKKVTAEWLKYPFVVTTRWQNAGGRSRLPRYFGQINVAGRDLGALLVSNGWARAKGTVAALPGITRAKDHAEKLQKLEADAKEKRRGLWAHSKNAKR
jgi:endonuclease YncB( thermonuclease family)